MTEIDSAAFEAGVAPCNFTAGRIDSADESDVAHFSDALGRIYITAQALLLSARPQAGHTQPALTLVVEDSANGSSWATVATFDFTASDQQSAAVDSPRAYLRASWADVSGTWAVDVAVKSIATPASGGGSIPNWCVVSLATPDPLTPDASVHSFGSDELTIKSQSGSDFSVGEAGGQAAILSASGGLFQAGIYLGCPAGPTIDAGSDHLRYLWFALTVGASASAPDLNGLGLDALVPIFPSGTANGPGGAASCLAGLAGLVSAGGPAVLNPVVFLVGGIGSDSVPLNAVFTASFGTLAIWQVG